MTNCQIRDMVFAGIGAAGTVAFATATTMLTMKCAQALLRYNYKCNNIYFSETFERLKKECEELSMLTGSLGALTAISYKIMQDALNGTCPA